MQAGSAAATTRRLSGGRIRGALIATAIAAALVAVPASTLAKGSSGGATTPWIALASVNGSASVQPKLGSWVTFSTGYSSNIRNPRVEVDCYQNGSLVYGEAGAPYDTFVLGGGSSIWLTTGGPASCTANLFYWGSHAGTQTYNLLASTSFTAG
jgi:hypothetical protein